MTENTLSEENVSLAESESDASVEQEPSYKWEAPPQFDIEYHPDCVCEVRVTIPAINITKTLDDVFGEMNDGVQVPGFRRGKAPRKLLEKKLGKYVRTVVIDRLTDAAAQELTEKYDLQPISPAEVIGLDKPEELTDNKDLTYSLKFEIPGKCHLADYASIIVEKPEYEINEGEIEAAIERLRTRFSRFETLDDGTAEDNDQVIISFKGFIEDKEFEGNSAENYPYILGSGRFHENIENVLRGAKAGDEFETTVPFPEDHHDKYLAGKVATFKIKVNEIKRRTLPELDVEFAKKVGCETIDELRDKTRKRLAEAYDENVKEFLRNQAIQKMVDASTFELPKGQIGRFIENERQSIIAQLQKNRVSLEEIETMGEEIDKSAEENGMYSIKSMYVVRAICEKENIQVTENDFDNYARNYSGDDEKRFELMKEYISGEGVASETASRILIAKAIDTILEKSTIKTIPAQQSTEDLGDDKQKEDS